MAGVLRLPSGLLVRGRGLRRPLPAGPVPTFALYLLGHEPPPVPWEARWVRWPEFWLPSDPAAAGEALREAWARAQTDRVEIACACGYGRTGTALACLAVLDGLPARRGGQLRPDALRGTRGGKPLATPLRHPLPVAAYRISNDRPAIAPNPDLPAGAPAVNELCLRARRTAGPASTLPNVRTGARGRSSTPE